MEKMEKYAQRERLLIDEYDVDHNIALFVDHVDHKYSVGYFGKENEEPIFFSEYDNYKEASKTYTSFICRNEAREKEPTLYTKFKDGTHENANLS
jgi:hypothetical protein